MLLVGTIATAAACCMPLSEAPLNAADADRLAAALKVIADPARLRLVSLIQARPDGQACACELQGSLGLSQPTVSHHLKVMVDAGLLERIRRGRWAYFRVVPESLAALTSLLA
jgi:ArsR family transcriptional regulator